MAGPWLRTSLTLALAPLLANSALGPLLWQPLARELSHQGRTLVALLTGHWELGFGRYATASLALAGLLLWRFGPLGPLGAGLLALALSASGMAPGVLAPAWPLALALLAVAQGAGASRGAFLLELSGTTLALTLLGGAAPGSTWLALGLGIGWAFVLAHRGLASLGLRPR